MATIQNQSVIQKLIDDLELYPALEKMPTELADKILPTFQVNPEQNVILKNNFSVKHFTSTANTYTITIPDDKVWIINNMACEYTCVAIVDNRYFQCLIEDKDGNFIASFCHNSAMTSGQGWYYTFIEGTGVDGTINGGIFHRNIAFIKDLVLPEGATLKFWDYGNQQPTDSMEINLIVDEQDA